MKKIDAVSEHNYNPNLYFLMKTGVWILFFALLVCGCFVVYYSLMGIVYNPIYRIPADVINSYLNKNLVPFSIPEFNRIYISSEVLTVSGLYDGVLAIMLFSIAYLVIASCFTFYWFCILSSVICSWIDDYFQKYNIVFNDANHDL